MILYDVGKDDECAWIKMVEMIHDLSKWQIIELGFARITAIRCGARYTWTNKQLNPVRCVLDMVVYCPGA
jgi:uncharacterized membrane protein YhfC